MEWKSYFWLALYHKFSVGIGTSCSQVVLSLCNVPLSSCLWTPPPPAHPPGNMISRWQLLLFYFCLFVFLLKFIFSPSFFFTTPKSPPPPPFFHFCFFWPFFDVSWQWSTYFFRFWSNFFHPPPKKNNAALPRTNYTHIPAGGSKVRHNAAKQKIISIYTPEKNPQYSVFILHHSARWALVGRFFFLFGCFGQTKKNPNQNNCFFCTGSFVKIFSNFCTHSTRNFQLNTTAFISFTRNKCDRI